jgi:AAA domain
MTDHGPIVDQLRAGFRDGPHDDALETPAAEAAEDQRAGADADAGPLEASLPEPADVGIAEAAPNGTEPDQAEQASSWTPVDLGAIEATEQPPPTLLPRTDDRCLLYEGKVAEVAAPPESCKGWLAVLAATEPLLAGHPIIYVDFESSAGELVERLRAVGVPDERIAAQVSYFGPHEPLTYANRADLDAALAREPALVVIDGVTEALTIHGLDLNDNADVARWLELLPRPAARSGAAVLMIDHVTKDREARGAYSLGAGHKLAGVAVAYSLTVIEPFGRGRVGVVKVKVRKDRPGHVRAHADGDDVGTMRLASDPTTGAVSVVIEPPTQERRFRPTVLMERLSAAIEATPGMGKREVRDAVPGKSAAKDEALRLLIAEGWVRVDRNGSAQRHHPERPYLAAEDPLAEDTE